MALRDIVLAHMHDTITYVYATGSRATAIQADLTTKAFPVKKGKAPAGRHVKSVTAVTLAELKPANSWLFIALVDSAPDLAELATFIRNRDPTRIRIYFPPGTDLHDAMQYWPRDVPLPRIEHYRDLPEFRKDVGIAINNRIALDFGG